MNKEQRKVEKLIKWFDKNYPDIADGIRELQQMGYVFEVPEEGYIMITGFNPPASRRQP